VLEVTKPAFRAVTVFDVSQTEGKELPGLAADELTGDVKDYADFFGALEKAAPVPVGFEKIQGGAKGYYHLEDKRVAINQGMSEVQTVKTAIHEIAHAKLHGIDLTKQKDVPEKQRKNRREREVEAESVAYTVCQHYGIDTSDYSFGYVVGWSSGKETKELKASLELIRQTASGLITSIDENFREIVHARQQAALEQATTVQKSVAVVMEAAKPSVKGQLKEFEKLSGVKKLLQPFKKSELERG
jgi:antirestriction protein ArdC